MSFEGLPLGELTLFRYEFYLLYANKADKSESIFYWSYSLHKIQCIFPLKNFQIWATKLNSIRF